MVRVRSFNQQANHAALPDAAHIARWLSISSATATLIGLSALNAMHGPASDCVRAGASFLRSRRGPFVSMVQMAQRTESYGANVTLTSRLSARP